MNIKQIILALSVFLLTAPSPSSQIVMNPDEPTIYPEGVYCTPAGDMFHGLQTPDHPCKCKNMLREDKDGCCDVKVTNDPVCKQWCHEEHCGCPMECIKGRPDETEPHDDGGDR